jgi:PAS domain-containing protein
MRNGIAAPAFRLLRYYSIASFLVILAATAGIGFAYRQLAMVDFMRMGQHVNEDLAAVFANLLWQEHAPFIARADWLPGAELRSGPEAKKLDAAVRRMMQGHGLVRMKIYAPSGLTAYSSEAIQIGEQQGDNPGFRAALSGHVVSELVYRDSINAFDRRYESRNLISSYVPLREAPAQPVLGVVELYEDVTPYLEELQQAQWKAVVGLGMALVLVYGALVLVVMRAHRILEREKRGLAAASPNAGARSVDAGELHPLALAIAQSPSPVVITDAQGAMVYANPAYDERTWRRDRHYPVRDADGRVTHVVHWQDGA